MAYRIKWIARMSSLTALSLGGWTALLAAGPDEIDQNWPIFGRTTAEQHFSPLDQINVATVGRLGLAWFADLDAPWSVSAPVENDGIVYTAVGLSMVSAFDVTSGKLLWSYDPHVADSPEHSRLRGPTWGIRGLAYDQGNVFVGTKDGRLLSIDARTGALNWQVMTLEPGMDSATISGPPRVFAGKVLTGFGGADVGTTRGYVTAYDEATGKRRWRFWTVPGDPAKGFENAAMAMAAKTWKGQWWRFGGGGTAWNAMTYDKEFNRIYIGTGNGGPWNQKIRSPGGGDNLFICSVVALDADTGKYLWHYQTAPGESWDYNSVMDIELAHLTIGGEDVPVLMHAPKNGFFYLIDRRDGKLISADKFSKVTWADHVDLKTGRPVEAYNAHYDHGPTTIYPGSVGAHNWLPMSFNPGTGLVYIPETTLPGSYADQDDLAGYRPRSGVHSATGIDFTKGPGGNLAFGSSLIAWDPIAGKPRWQVKLPGYWNGGTITTAGNLVFQGRVDGQFVAYAADSGKVLWSYDARAPVTAPPITYSWRGTQYVTVITGISGGGAAAGPLAAAFGWDYRTYPRRVMTFALNGKVALPPALPKTVVAGADDPTYRPDPKAEARGQDIYGDLSCIACHGPQGVSGGAAPDLRGSPIPMDADAFARVVSGGALAPRGMPRYDDLRPDEIAALRQYIRSRAANLRQSHANS